MKVVYHSLFFLILWSSTSLLKAHEPTEFYNIINEDTWPDGDYFMIVLKVEGTTKKINNESQYITCVAYDRNDKPMDFHTKFQSPHFTTVSIMNVPIERRYGYKYSKCFNSTND